VTGKLERKLKFVFRTYLRQKGIDLRQRKTKMISGPFYTYRRIHFTSGNVSSSVIIPGELHVSAATCIHKCMVYTIHLYDIQVYIIHLWN